MSSLNKVQLIGNLGRDPEIRHTPNGTVVCNVNLATSSSWTDKNSGERVEATEWHRIVFFKGLAEIVGEHMKKGRSMYVEGRLQTRKWQDKDGNDQYTTQVVGDTMLMLDKPDGTKRSVEPSKDQGFPPLPPLDDDIPF